MDFKRKKIRIGDVLLKAGVITEEQLQTALSRQKGSGRKLGETLIDEGFVSEEEIARALSEQLHMDIIDLQNVNIAEEILQLVPANVLRKNKAVPFEYAKDNVNVLRVAMEDPLDMFAMDDITIITNLQVEPVVATSRSIMLALDHYFGQEDTRALEQYTREKEIQMEEEEDSYSEDINNSPIVQLVRSMIEQAVLQRASDIHIEPMERQLRVRYRVDGALYEKATYSTKLLPALSARIKIIGGMDITEKRKPQDGRITQVVNRQEYDIRVSVIPTIFGEKIVMRLAAKNSFGRKKEQLGLNARDMKIFDHILKNPHGIILVTGPTGSGKSTTMYTALSEINTPEVNIITVEDPVEANLDGVNQIQVNPKADLTFATALRSILRQDPDIIMIGEIRDRETAGIAVQASITGHLVMSTLHTNSAASTITRLIDMGIESFLIADSMVGVIAQRLVRRLCPACRKRRRATAEEKELLKISHLQEADIYEPCGCGRCENIGYKGRIGVYEIMEITPSLKTIISKGGDAEDIKNQALKEGMYTLRMSATELVLDGTTSLSEMLKVSFEV
ncbi:MAG: ATPase, T2SS/T4P/T4SS family [Lachnospiraceae bacterium]|nr:Flp pilus assembly complex ATPase component TadA [Lachnospiraceae bacterium]MDD7050640.1 ATPase, T2SS/T4P/T4SS family [Lachnospiraceae bacterium]MDY3222977.1 ATPase, T2SS/T4P/T4SS family [Lachnospiraceae bacterium]MDY4096661.1 ATPase, T2SS/T4P/T4SS family [Lachnospiraceae bacterium]